ncbi:reverse transcriptase domain-containing protein, partial [Tanacetum coccineum]
MADNRTMAQMLQAPIEGYEDAIVIPPINANNFELKQPLINLVQSNKFTGRQDPHNHLRFFNKVTSTFRHPEVPNTSVKLLLFPFSLDGEARDWLDKEPPRSILTWDDLVSKFINQFFPPSKTTYLRNKITNFFQEPNETFNEAWERFKGLLRQCPHHGFSELHQLDTFYNSLNSNDQDALDSAAGGNFLDKMPQEGLAIIESKSKILNNSFDMQQIAASLEDKMTIKMNQMINQMKALVVTTPAPVKAVEENVQNQNQDLQNQMANVTSLLTSLCTKFDDLGNTNQPLSSSSLPSNTIPNPRNEAKAITTRSGASYDGPPIPPPVVEKESEVTKDTELPSTEDIQPPLVQEQTIDKELIEEPSLSQKTKPNLPYPSRLTKEKIREKDDSPMLRKIYGNTFVNHHFELSFSDALIHMSKVCSDGEIPLKECDSIVKHERLKWVMHLPLTHNNSTNLEEVELKELPPQTLEYAFLEENNKLPVIISKDLSQDEKTSLINVLKNRKQAIAWKLSDIRGIDPEFCSHKILLEDDYEPSVQHQRRVNPKIHDVIKKEVEKLLDAGLIYPRYFQIPIDPKDQEKTTFTCPYGTFAYRQKMMEVFMDDFLVFGDSFSSCLANLDKMLKRCEDTKLALNWEKSHFMVKEGIVLGHKISRKGIEVDKAKVDVISKLPHPTTVKGIRSFLGHAGFYRRFIKDFSKISRPMTHLLEKNTPFIFSEDCILAFQTLKKKLTEAPILIAPNWDQPFEIMCDASDYAIGAVLGQRIEKHFRPIHYASKTMTEAETNYTTTEKEMLAVVYAFEKFRSYLIMNKSVVYTDHSALKYLFNKKDAKARLLRWVLLLQEFDFKVIDTKGAENYAADHLSRLENPYENTFDPKEITETFPLETLSVLTSKDQSTPWFADFANYHAGNFIKKGMSTQEK